MEVADGPNGTVDLASLSAQPLRGCPRDCAGARRRSGFGAASIGRKGCQVHSPECAGDFFYSEFRIGEQTAGALQLVAYFIPTGTPHIRASLEIESIRRNRNLSALVPCASGA